VAQLGLGLIVAFQSFFSIVPRTIERAFLENDPSVLASLFSRDTPLLVSLPQPLVFSDMLTGEQAYWVFERIFRTYQTIEFFPEVDRVPVFSSGGFILKSRWSLKDPSSQTQWVLQVFWHIRPGTPAGRKKPLWAVTEIKAEEKN
jgi:hypothetical protein